MIDGLRLMAVGMTTVFAFLGLLVLAMRITAALVVRYAPDPTPSLPVAGDEAEAIAVALAAIARSRS